MGSAASVSRQSLVLEVGTASKMRCDLRRHLSPRTVGILTRSLPLRGNAHLMLGGAAVYIKTDLDSGLERPRTSFARGDVAFLPFAGGLCFFVRDVPVSKKMSLVGRLGGDIGILESVRAGTALSLVRDTACI